MSKVKISTETYSCSKLKGNAHLSLKHKIIDEENMYLISFDCEQKLNCGIAKEISRGFSFDWDLCPAHTELKIRRK